MTPLPLPIGLLATAAVLAFAAAASITPAGAESQASPIFGVTVPEAFRQWPLVAPALEDDPLNELRAVVGNSVAMQAYATGTQPFPDGSILVKRAWKRTPSPEFNAATVPGAATTVQVMVKDSRRYAATGGWGFGRFVDGIPVDEAQHETCFGCHAALVSERDFVFTRLAP